MSVINRMLQDLDARGATQPVHNIPDVPYKVNAKARRDTHSWRWWAAAWLALAGAGGYAVHQLAPTFESRTHAVANSWHRAQQQMASLWRWVPGVKPVAHLHSTASVASIASVVPTAAVSVASTAQPAQPAATMSFGLTMDQTLSALVHDSHPVRVARHPAMHEAAHVAPTKTALKAVSKVPHEAAPAQTETVAQPAVAAARQDAGNARRFTMIDAPAAGAGSSPMARAASAYRRALDLSDEGRDAAAIDAALEALRLDPQHSAARRIAVASALNLSRVEQANALIDEGLKADPNDAELQYLRARALVVSGLNDQALATLQGQAHPTADALGLKAGLLAGAGQYPQAARAYEQALRDQPSNATWWLGLGVACDAQGQAVSARNAFTRARALGTLRGDLQAWVEQKLASN